MVAEKPQRMVQVDLGRNKATLDGTAVKFTPLEASLLAILAGYRGQIVARDTLKAGLWGTRQPKSADIELRGLVLRVRRKIRPCGFDIDNFQPGSYELIDDVLPPTEVTKA